MLVSDSPLSPQILVIIFFNQNLETKPNTKQIFTFVVFTACYELN